MSAPAPVRTCHVNTPAEGARSRAFRSKLGIDPRVVEAILNHVSSSKSGKDGVAGIYNKAAYLKKKKEALDAWAAFILAAVATSTTPDGARIDEPATALPSPAA
jgi:hypothetical protein